MDVPLADVAVVFEVNGVPYAILLSQINSFPIQNSLINTIVRHKEENSMGVEMSDSGAIVIKTPNYIDRESERVQSLIKNTLCSENCLFDNFGLIVRIYQNPKITLYELLQVQGLLDTIRSQMGTGSTEQKEEIESHRVYNFLRKNNYKEFLRELDFYGISSLFGSKLHRDGIDHEKMMADIKKNLESKFSADYLMHAPSSRAEDFLNVVASIGGIISGSFVLESILDEDWGAVNKIGAVNEIGDNRSSDIDIYVNEHMLKGMLTQCGLYEPFKLLDEWARASAKVMKTAATYLVGQSVPYTQISSFVKEFNKTAITDSEKYVGICAATHFGVFKASLDDVVITKDDGRFDGAYRYSGHILYVIKFKLPCGPKVDIVVVSCTPQYQLYDFDLNFCKVYYDGYTVHALDWKSLVSKKSNNYTKFHRRGLSNLDGFVKNIDRIEKYFKRGFIICTGNLSE